MFNYSCSNWHRLSLGLHVAKIASFVGVCKLGSVKAVKHIMAYILRDHNLQEIISNFRVLR